MDVSLKSDVMGRRVTSESVLSYLGADAEFGANAQYGTNDSIVAESTTRASCLPGQRIVGIAVAAVPYTQSDPEAAGFNWFEVSHSRPNCPPLPCSLHPE